jgi:hypothetical protein
MEHNKKRKKFQKQQDSYDAAAAKKVFSEGRNGGETQETKKSAKWTKERARKRKQPMRSQNKHHTRALTGWRKRLWGCWGCRSG